MGTPNNGTMLQYPPSRFAEVLASLTITLVKKSYNLYMNINIIYNYNIYIYKYMISWHFNQNLWLWHQGVRQGHPEQVGAPQPRTIEGGGLRTIRRRCRWGHVGHVFVKLFVSNHSWSRGSWRGTCLAYGRVDSVASQEGHSKPCARSFWVVYDVYSQAIQDSEKIEHSEMWSCFWFY